MSKVVVLILEPEHNLYSSYNDIDEAIEALQTRKRMREIKPVPNTELSSIEPGPFENVERKYQFDTKTEHHASEESK